MLHCVCSCYISAHGLYNCSLGGCALKFTRLFVIGIRQRMTDIDCKLATKKCIVNAPVSLLSLASCLFIKLTISASNG